MSVAYGEQQRNSSALSASGAGGQRELERQYHVVLHDSLGHPALGFREGTWFRLTVSGPQPLQLRGAIRTCPHAAGSIVQIACWWMRENPMQPRSLDLATELALTVGELVRVAPAEGLGTTSMDLLPMAMAAVAASGPPVAPAPPLPGGSGAYGSTPALGSSNGFGSGDALYGSGASSSSANGYSSTSSTSSTSATSSAATSGYGSTPDYSSTSAYTSTGTYGSTSAYGSTSSDAYSSGASGYGSSASAATHYGSSSSNYVSSPYSLLKDPLNDPLDQSSYSTPASTGAYASSNPYDAQTSYLPAVTSATAPPAAANNGWFDPADGTGTGGFPAVPPAPVMGRPAQPAQAVQAVQPMQSAPPAPVAPKKPYSPPNPGVNPGAGAGRGGYQGGGATQQAALPPANRPRESGADWEPRAAAPRRPAGTGMGSTGSSHQPRSQQQPAVQRPVPGATGQPPRPRPQPPRDGYSRPAEPPQDPGRSSDRNGGIPPRRPAAAAPQQRGTMGRRPATRPGRPSER